MNRIDSSTYTQTSLRRAAVLPHRAGGFRKPLSLTILAASVMLVGSSAVLAGPAGGVVVTGAAAITTGPGTTVINQSTDRAAINWQSFDIARGESVRINQPGSTSVLLNRVVGANPSAIFGSLSANGQVFLVNPNGILFGNGASVNVGGLVASSLGISDADFMAGRASFSGTRAAAVVNEGTIRADGGYVVLLGGSVTNDGTVNARLGAVALAAGDAVSLDISGDKLLSVSVGRDALNAAVRNGGVISADGGQVVLTTQVVGSLLASAVNNSGVIEARTVSNQAGTIRLLAGAGEGTVLVAGTLDASAPAGGNGGFIDTSAGHVKVADSARISTAAAKGKNGTWLIDPQDFTIGSGPNDNISGPTLSALLVTNSVIISTNTGPDVTNTAVTPPVTNLNTATAGNGDINVNQAVSWTASTNPTTLSLLASRDVNFNAAVTATNGNLVVCCGRDINVNAALTTTNGSMLLSAGRNAIINGALTTTDGNIAICAANDISIGSKITLTRGSTIPQQSLALAPGLTLNSGFGGTGPGEAGGTVRFAPLAPQATVTGPGADVVINYNPPSYAAPTDYRPNFVLTNARLTQHMLVFAAGADKVFDGTTSATLTGLKNAPAGVMLNAGPGATAAFDSADAGTGKVVTFSGYDLSGPNAGSYALPTSCCGTVVFRTTGVIAPTPGAPAGTVATVPGVQPVATPGTSNAVSTQPGSINPIPGVQAGPVLTTANGLSTQPGLITPAPELIVSTVAPVGAVIPAGAIAHGIVNQSLVLPGFDSAYPSPVMTQWVPPVVSRVEQPAPTPEFTAPPVLEMPPVAPPAPKRPPRLPKQDRN